MTSRDTNLGIRYIESDSRLRKAIEILASKEPGEWTDTSEISQKLGLSSHEMGNFTQKLGKKGIMWIDSRLHPHDDVVNPRQIRITQSKYSVIRDYLFCLAG